MNKNKYTSTYALASQGIFSMIVFAALGYCIGYFAISSVLWGVVLAIVGLLLGLVMFISNLLYILNKAEKEKKNNEKNE